MFVFDPHRESQTCPAPIDWPGLVTANPVCNVISHPTASGDAMRVVIAAPGDRMPADTATELRGFIARGGAVAVHGPSLCTVMKATQSIAGNMSLCSAFVPVRETTSGMKNTKSSVGDAR